MKDETRKEVKRALS